MHMGLQNMKPLKCQFEPFIGWLHSPHLLLQNTELRGEAEFFSVSDGRKEWGMGMRKYWLITLRIKKKIIQTLRPHKVFHKADAPPA